MKPALFLISLLVLLSAPILFAPGHAQTSSYAQDMSYGVEVQFWNNTSTYASYLSSKYNVRLVMADNELGWAVFRPSDNNAFVNALAKERFVRFAGQVPQSCPLTCGSGGGSGGGGSGGSSTTPDFSISVSPSYMGLMPGSSGASQIVLTSLNSFYGTIALSLRVSPETQAIRVSPSSVYLNYTGAGTTATSILTIDPYLDVGRYAISVIGTYSPTSLSHTAYMTLDVTTDFGINSIPSSISIQDG